MSGKVDSVAVACAAVSGVEETGTGEPPRNGSVTEWIAADADIRERSGRWGPRLVHWV